MPYGLKPMYLISKLEIMKKLYLIGLIMLAIGWGSDLFSQTIVRSTICSIGATLPNGNTGTTTLVTTFGSDCIGCGTLVDGNGNILIQGFPHPSDVNPDCTDLALFDYDAETTGCGTTFSFFYLGVADIANATFEWNFGADAFPETSSSPNPVGVSFSAIGTKMITLRVIEEDCDVTEEITLQVSDLGFAVNAIISDVNCFGDTNGSIELETNNGTAPFTYTWSNGLSNPIISNLEAGDYNYSVIDADGCEISNMVSVSGPAEELAVTFNITNATCSKSEDGSIGVIVTGGTLPYTFEWSNGETTNLIQNLNPNTYSVTVTDNQGCVLSADNEAIVGEKCNPHVFNIISPNGDGMNDVWEIENIQDFPDSVVKIYNRWGNLVFEEEGYLNTWEGTDNDGNPLLAGAYYYVIELNDPDNMILTGSVTLIR